MVRVLLLRDVMEGSFRRDYFFAERLLIEFEGVESISFLIIIQNSSNYINSEEAFVNLSPTGESQ